LAPFQVLRDFLAPAEAAHLLGHAAARQAAFAPTEVRVEGQRRVDPTRRVSLGLRDLGETGPLLERRLRAAASELTAALGMAPFAVSHVELHLVAHGDGAFYGRHIDTRMASEARNIRMLSGVYYVFREPRAFTGGALRLHALDARPRFVDIEPVHNSLAVFPAWVPHEVLPVSVPSGAFGNGRFAVSCWLYARKPGAR
jgi:Rps23 Pro-64 3,4-dihydroxylase Tpa1-like proline 4-hydroxylase